MGIIIIASIIGIALGIIGFGLAKSAKPGEVNDRAVLLVITALLPILVIGFGVAGVVAS
jgi:hypothetical protein